MNVNIPYEQNFGREAGVPLNMEGFSNKIRLRRGQAFIINDKCLEGGGERENLNNQTTPCRQALWQLWQRKTPFKQEEMAIRNRLREGQPSEK